MRNMVSKLLLLVVLCSSIYGFPQHIRVPKNISPAEVNQLIGQSSKFSSTIQSQSSLGVIVSEVEAMLKANPNLPRLTKGEILDLLENITRNDQSPQIIQQTPQVSYTHVASRDPKAVMMVLPYTPDVANGNNVEDFYTKPPITHIVDYGKLDYNEADSSSSVINYHLTKGQLETANEIGKPSSAKGKKYRGTAKPAYIATTTIRAKTTTTTSTTTEAPKFQFVEQRPLHYRRKTVPTSSTTTTFPTSSHSLRSRRPTRSRLTIGTTTTRYENHRYEDDFSVESSVASSSTIFPSSGLKIVKSPFIPPKIINEDLLAVTDDNKEANDDKDIPVSFLPVKEIDLTISDDKEKNGAAPLIIEIPEHLKGVLNELNLESAFKAKPKKHNKPRGKTTTKPIVNPLSEKDDEQLKQLLKTLELLAAQTSTTTTPIPDVSEVVDNLSPDMKELLINFGLIPNPNPPKLESASQIYESYNPEKAEVKPDSYVGFKPLPEDDTSRSEMQELLARFGLGRSIRKQKSVVNSIKKNKISNLDMVPQEYQKILQDLGLGNKDDNLDYAHYQQQIPHLFNPSENRYATKEEVNKLTKLSSLINRLVKLNRTITGDELVNLDSESLKLFIDGLKMFVKINDSSKSLHEQEAPDPIDFGLGSIKKEVKREENTDQSKTQANQIGNSKNANEIAKEQIEVFTSPPVVSQSSTASTTAEITETLPVETEATTAATTEAQTVNMKDLIDSFGSETNSDDEAAAPQPAPEKKTGAYYLLDWNSFFDIDDQKGRRVNIRLQPKVGDPSRFYSISVP